jgi:hypothetical protein
MELVGLAAKLRLWGRWAAVAALLAATWSAALLSLVATRRCLFSFFRFSLFFRLRL